MRMAALAGLMLAAGGAAAEAAVVLPSGLEARLLELRRETDGGGEVVRLRFVAPGFRRDMGFETVAADLDHLCGEVALRRAEVTEGARVIVSLADRPVAFGVASPGIAQVFEAYRVRGGRCILEDF